jgi:hypothetical protein
LGAAAFRAGALRAAGAFLAAGLVVLGLPVGIFPSTSAKVLSFMLPLRTDAMGYTKERRSTNLPKCRGLPYGDPDAENGGINGGNGNTVGDGFGYGVGFGFSNGFGEVRGDGFGCVNGEGRGCSYGDGLGRGFVFGCVNGDGYGLANGDGRTVGNTDPSVSTSVLSRVDVFVDVRVDGNRLASKPLFVLGLTANLNDLSISVSCEGVSLWDTDTSGSLKPSRLQAGAPLVRENPGTVALLLAAISASVGISRDGILADHHFGCAIGSL